MGFCVMCVALLGMFPHKHHLPCNLFMFLYFLTQVEILHLKFSLLEGFGILEFLDFGMLVYMRCLEDRIKSKHKINSCF